ncbi:hypothetical protein MXB_2949 [Myxobolus squamalis]|nr:hypothetical protein MXB_2949 [Myxobolus squamalis]
MKNEKEIERILNYFTIDRQNLIKNCIFLSTVGSENPCCPLLRDFGNSDTCSSASACLGRHSDFSLFFRVAWESDLIKEFTISSY